MSTPFLSEIKIVSFGFAPKGWALCNGQILPINQNQALFSLLGTTYGGNGQTTFALPDLRSRSPLHGGNGFFLGDRSGEENQTLTLTQLPAHAHAASGSNAAPSAGPSGSTWATHATPAYSGAPNTSMNAASTTATGGGQPHNNMPPFLTLNIIIALQGIFPSRN